MNRDEFRALTPWSFFLPIALAVALGGLVANALGVTLFGPDRDTAVADAAPAAPSAGGESSNETPGALPRPGTGSQAPAPATAQAATPVLRPVSLPGPTSARRDGETRACIGGTIAVRAANGWEQEMVEDAPARCVASSR